MDFWRLEMKFHTIYSNPQRGELFAVGIYSNLSEAHMCVGKACKEKANMVVKFSTRDYGFCMTLCHECWGKFQKHVEMESSEDGITKSQWEKIVVAATGYSAQMFRTITCVVAKTPEGHEFARMIYQKDQI